MFRIHTVTFAALLTERHTLQTTRLFIASLLVAIGIVVIAVVLHSHRRKYEQLRSNAIVARELVSAAAEKLPNLESLTRTLENVTTDLNDNDTAMLTKLLDGVTTAYGDANAFVSPIDGIDLESAKLSATKYRRIINKLSQQRTLYAYAKKAATDLKRQCTRLQKEVHKAPETLRVLKESYKALLDAQDVLTQQELRTDVDDDTEEIKRLLDLAEQQITDKHHGQALDELHQAHELIVKVQEEFDDLVRTRDVIVGRLEELTKLFDETHPHYVAVMADYKVMKRYYHPECLMDISLIRQQAIDYWEDAEISLDNAREATSTKDQRWSDAASDLDHADHLIESVSAILYKVMKHKKKLDKLAGSLYGEVVLLLRDVTSSQRRLDNLRGDQSHTRIVLDELREEVEDLQYDMLVRQPRYFTIERERGEIAKNLRHSMKLAKGVDRLARDTASTSQRSRQRKVSDILARRNTTPITRAPRHAHSKTKVTMPSGEGFRKPLPSRVKGETGDGGGGSW